MLKHKGHIPFHKIVAVVAALNVLWLLIHQIFFYLQMRDAYKAGFHPQIDVEATWRLIRISLCLVIVAIGLFSHKIVSLCFAGSTLLLIICEYIFWYVASLNTLRNADITTLPPSEHYTFHLIGATKWNAFILIFTLVSLIWVINLLVLTIP